MKTQVALGTVSLGGSMGLTAKGLRLLAIEAAALLALASVPSLASAANCERADGKSFSGQYLQRPLVSGAKADSGMALTIQQKGCQLTVDGSILSTWFDVGSDNTVKAKTQKTKSGRWILDLSGEKPAVIPPEYIAANSRTAAAAAMTKSLEVRTKLNDRGDIDVTVRFDVEHDGAKVRMQVEGSFDFYLGETYTGGYPDGSSMRKHAGSLHLGYRGIDVSVVPDARLEEETGAKNLAIRTSANWFLSFARPFINSILNTSVVDFLKQ